MNARERHEKRLEIARQLAGNFLQSQNSKQSVLVDTANPVVSTLPPKDVKSRKKNIMIKMTTSDSDVYSMELEKKMITEYNLSLFSDELDKISSKNFKKIASIVDIVLSHLNKAFFGCDIDMGICTDVNLKEIEYFGANKYIRKMSRKDGITCFTCMDKRDLIVEVQVCYFLICLDIHCFVGNWCFEVQKSNFHGIFY